MFITGSEALQTCKINLSLIIIKAASNAHLTWYIYWHVRTLSLSVIYVWNWGYNWTKVNMKASLWALRKAPSIAEVVLCLHNTTSAPFRTFFRGKKKRQHMWNQSNILFDKKIFKKETGLLWLFYHNCSVVSEVIIWSETVSRLHGWHGRLTELHPSCASFLLIADCTCKCGDVCQHQGSRWALPRARLSALCQALLMSASASLQRFWRDESNTSLCGRSICKEWQSTRAQPHSFPGQVRNLRC